MEKDQAIAEMMQGKKITHRFFSPNEWMTMEEGKILLEDGVKCHPDEFWKWRKDNNWNDGYFIYDEILNK